jgi:uncharacterized protein
MPELMQLFNPQTVDLEPEPIRPDWIVSGTPTACSKKLLTSRDWTANVVVWECTPGAFHWRYTRDETIYVLAGEAFISYGKDQEHRFAAGDLGYFPNGLVCNWRITKTFRKFVTSKETMLAPLGLSVKVCKKLLRQSGVLGKPQWPPILDVPVHTQLAGESVPRAESAVAAAVGTSGASFPPHLNR